ncbi:calcium-binding protein [Indioceanicola profundi]|uniref:calcium-binding protein n=1 Tax=Indioceanicola profundi TaxID=2220096 RepID=UPI000E6A9C75|nr:calcium-binding protein [Indioceanicola profundi]
MSHSQNTQARATTRATFDDIGLYIGSARGDQFPGAGIMDLVFGRDGNDRLTGGALADDLVGGAGNDRLVDNAGMDHLDGGMGMDRLEGGAEADDLTGGIGDDRLDEGVGHGDLEGGPGDDVIVGGLGGDAFVVSPDSGHDVIKDFVAGPALLDHLAIRDIAPEDLRFEDTEAGVLISWNGNQGSVLLENVFKRDLSQADFMFADDRQVIQPTSPDSGQVTAVKFIIDEGDAATAPVFTADDEPAERFQFDEFLVRVGQDGNDTFQGTAERDFLIGMAGDDHLAGGAENDDLLGSGGNDTLVGDAGQDHLMGGMGDDELHGGEQADSLMGEEGSDRLHAGAGHDMLEGGMGDDILDGGDGADAFIVSPDSGNDVIINGFDAGQGSFDHIAFRNLTAEQVTVSETTRDDMAGVLVSWNTQLDTGPVVGSVFLANLTIGQMAQDDFMFEADDAPEGTYEDTPGLQGSNYIFRDDPVSTVGIQATGVDLIG